jgi:hypothetical protein
VTRKGYGTAKGGTRGRGQSQRGPHQRESKATCARKREPKKIELGSVREPSLEEVKRNERERERVGVRGMGNKRGEGKRVREERDIK